MNKAQWHVLIALLEDHPNCFERDCWADTSTWSSAWLLDRQQLLLTHHPKLNMWLQLGGHGDGDPDTTAVAKEAEENPACLWSLSATKF